MVRWLTNVFLSALALSLALILLVVLVYVIVCLLSVLERCKVSKL